jgi:hypothetical protein
MEPERDAPTALMPREALRELIDASVPEDVLDTGLPLHWIALGIAAALLTLFFAIVTRF